MDQSSTLSALLETSTIDDSYGLGLSLSLSIAIIDIVDPPALLEDSTCPSYSNSYKKSLKALAKEFLFWSWPERLLLLSKIIELFTK
jgi:hypothetical protein